MSTNPANTPLLNRFLRFVEELPKTPSQRVQKAKLRDLGITPDTFDRTPDR